MTKLNLGFGYGVGGFGQGYYGGTSLPYYMSLATSQYQNSPKFLAWLAVNLQILDDVLPVVLNFDYYFDLDNAVGAQLDMLGEYIGQSRTVGFEPTGGMSPVLDDDTYRLLLKARVAVNTWDGRLNSLQPLWKALFPGGTIGIIDNQDMSMSLTLSGAFTSIIQDLIVNGYIVPRPEGVLLNVVLGTDLPFFGFDRDDSTVAGFDKGKFI